MSTPETIMIPAKGMVFSGLSMGPADGPPLLLLHGFPVSSLAWRYQIPRFAAAGYRTVAFDMRGYSAGARPSGIDPYSLGELAGDVQAVADSLGFDGFHLAGLDWGAPISAVFAAQHPQRLISLSMVSTPHPRTLWSAYHNDPKQRAALWYFEAFRELDAPEKMLGAHDHANLRAVYSGAQEEAIDAYVRVIGDPGALTAALNYYRATDWTDWSQPQPVAVPTLYLWGTENIYMHRAAAEANHQNFGRPYAFKVLDGVGHWAAEEAPDEVSRRILEHLSQYS